MQWNSTKRKRQVKRLTMDEVARCALCGPLVEILHNQQTPTQVHEAAAEFVSDHSAGENPGTLPPAELNKMIEAELQRIAKQKEAEALEPVN